MATKKEVLDQKAFLSDRISTQVRSLDLSILAVVWLFLVGGHDSPVLPSDPDRSFLLSSGLLALLSLLTDYAQYLAGYRATSDVLSQAEASGVVDVKYDTKSFWYKLRTVCFVMKQALMGGSAVFLGLAIVLALLHGTPS